MPQTEEQSINLTFEQKESLVDKLLIFMKNELENQGTSIKIGIFDFHFAYTEEYIGAPDENFSEGCDLSAFKNITGIDDEKFQIIMNYCFTNEYVKKAYMGSRKFDNIQLTDSGHTRAISAAKAQYKKPTESNMQNINIGSINGDNVQIGNNNVQNITNTF